MSAQMGCGVGVEDFAGGIPGPQVRGTGGTLFCGLQSLQDRGHPPAFVRIYRDLGSGLLRPVESPVPKCEGPGAPSSVVYKACRTGGIRLTEIGRDEMKKETENWKRIAGTMARFLGPAG